jgi:hypothetical protein
VLKNSFSNLFDFFVKLLFFSGVVEGVTEAVAASLPNSDAEADLETQFNRGVNVVIPIFGDFRQFSEIKMVFFLKTNVNSKQLSNRVKIAQFPFIFYGKNIF